MMIMRPGAGEVPEKAFGASKYKRGKQVELFPGVGREVI
jgi:hypothetical protein